MTQWFCRDKILGMERNSYPTDLTDEQWEILQPLIPPAKPGGRPRKTHIRDALLIDILDIFVKPSVRFYVSIFGISVRIQTTVVFFLLVK